MLQIQVSSIRWRLFVCIDRRQSGWNTGRCVWNISTRHNHHTVQILHRDYSSKFQLRRHGQYWFEIVRLRLEMSERNWCCSVKCSSHYDRTKMQNRGDDDKWYSNCLFVPKWCSCRWFETCRSFEMPRILLIHCLIEHRKSLHFFSIKSIPIKCASCSKLLLFASGFILTCLDGLNSRNQSFLLQMNIFKNKSRKLSFRFWSRRLEHFDLTPRTGHVRWCSSFIHPTS